MITIHKIAGLIFDYVQKLINKLTMAITVFKKALITVAIFLFTTYMFFACTKTTTKVPIVTTQSTIATIVNNATNLSLLDSILKKTGYILTLDSTGPFTLFASTDAAFTAAGYTDSVIYKDSISYLKRLVLYNLIYGDALTNLSISARNKRCFCYSKCWRFNLYNN